MYCVDPIPPLREGRAGTEVFSLSSQWVFNFISLCRCTRIHLDNGVQLLSCRVSVAAGVLDAS